MEHEPSLISSQLPSSRARALFALGLLVPAASIGTAAAMVFEATRGPVGQAIYGVCKVWLLAFPLAWHVFVERRPIRVAPPKMRGMAVGAALGLLIGAAIGGAYLLAGSRWIDAAQLRLAAQRNGIGSPIVYTAFAAYIVLVNSLLE